MSVETMVNFCFEAMCLAHLLATTVVNLSGIGFIYGNEMYIITNDMCKIHVRGCNGHCCRKFCFSFLYSFAVIQFGIPVWDVYIPLENVSPVSMQQMSITLF